MQDTPPKLPETRVPPLPIRAIRRLWRYGRYLVARVNEDGIWIIGHGRSGTTAIATLVARYGGLAIAPEHGWATRHCRDIHAGRMSLDAFFRRYKLAFSLPIVQTPGLTPILPMLKERYPRVRMIYIVRDPRDVVCSVITQSNQGDSEEFKITNPNFIVFDNRWLGIDESDPVRSVARCWCYLIDLAGRYPDIRFYRYEDFTENKVAFIGALAADYGIAQRHDISDQLDVQFRDARKIRGTGRWRRMLTPEAVASIESICSAHMRRFGYDPASAESAPSPVA